MTILGKIGLKIWTQPWQGIRSFSCSFYDGVVLSRETQGIDQLTGKDLGFIIAAAACGAASWLFYFLGLRMTSASKLASLDRLSLPLIILFSLLLLGETFSWKLVGGGILVTIGAILIALA